MDRRLGVQLGHQCRQWHVGAAHPGPARRKMGDAFPCLDSWLDCLFGPHFVWHLSLAFSDLEVAYGEPNGCMVAIGLHSGIEFVGGQFVLPLDGKTALGQARSTPMRAMALTVQYAIFQASLHV